MNLKITSSTPQNNNEILQLITMDKIRTPYSSNVFLFQEWVKHELYCLKSQDLQYHNVGEV